MHPNGEIGGDDKQHFQRFQHFLALFSQLKKDETRGNPSVLFVFFLIPPLTK
jgi:hypothetical protein